MIYPLIIIGSGPAALTASLYAGRSGITHIIVSGLKKGGQLIDTLEVENYPGFSHIGGFELIDTIEKHALKFGGTIVNDNIESVNFASQPLILISKKHKYMANSIIIATGSSPRMLGISNETNLLGRGVSYCATCDGNFFKNQVVAVVGGGNAATEEALYLSKLAKKVFLIHRNSTLRSEKILQDKLFSTPNIYTIWNSNIVELITNNNNNLSAIKTDQGETVELDGLFIAIGHTPNTEFLSNSVKLDSHNYILTGTKAKSTSDNFYATGTSVVGVFAAGDVQDPIYRQAITSAGSGCMAAIDVNNFLTVSGFNHRIGL